MNPEADIAVLTNKVESLHEDLSEMKLVMRDVANALTRLAVIDDRQSKMIESQDRIFKVLDSHDGRIVALEKDDSHQKMAVDWVYKAVWAMVGVAAMYAAKFMGLM